MAVRSAPAAIAATCWNGPWPAVRLPPRPKPGSADGLAAKSQSPFLPRPAPGPQHRLCHGLSAGSMVVWDPQAGPMAATTAGSLRDADFVLWKGHCSVHQLFRPEHVDQVRAKYPGMKVIVHPECRWEVVQKADHGRQHGVHRQANRSRPARQPMGHRHRSSPDQPPGPAAPGAEDHRPKRLPVPLHHDVPHRPAAPVLGLENLLEGKVVNQIKVDAERASGRRWLGSGADAYRHRGKCPQTCLGPLAGNRDRRSDAVESLSFGIARPRLRLGFKRNGREWRGRRWLDGKALRPGRRRRSGYFRQPAA